MIWFLGLVKFLSKFVANLSELANPSYEVQRSSMSGVGRDHKLAFERIKEVISNPPVLALCNTKDTMLSVDFYGIRAVVTSMFCFSSIIKV